MTDKTTLELAQEILKSANGLSDEMRSSDFASAAEELAQRVIEDMPDKSFLADKERWIKSLEENEGKWLNEIKEQTKAEQQEKYAEMCRLKAEQAATHEMYPAFCLNAVKSTAEELEKAIRNDS